MMNTREELRDTLKDKLLIGYGSVSKIEHYRSQSNFLQILYTYSILALQILNEYHEYHEEYEICAEIKKTVDLYNKATGTNYKL